VAEIEEQGAECVDCGQSVAYQGDGAEDLAETWCRAHALVSGHGNIERWEAFRPVDNLPRGSRYLIPLRER
jgi:hypothetical protein